MEWSEQELGRGQVGSCCSRTHEQPKGLGWEKQTGEREEEVLVTFVRRKQQDSEADSISEVRRHNASWCWEVLEKRCSIS